MENVIASVLRPQYKQEIIALIARMLQDKKHTFAQINQWGEDVSERLLIFLKAGKMVRGSLVLFSYTLFSEEQNNLVVTTGAALELLHAALLIHDDIMDQDTMRRGMPTFVKQYQSRDKVNENLHNGESLAICVGDSSFFLGYELLSRVNPRIISFVSRELTAVAFAQMQDVASGYTMEEPTIYEIIHTYQYKTGRYTFSLPLMLGAMLANQSNDVVQKFELLGEQLGILFQITDDALNLFGDEKDTGKPIGSDIRENKKTLFRAYLFAKADSQQRTKLRTLFGKTDVTSNDLTKIYDLLEALAVKGEIKIVVEGIQKKVEDLIAELPIPEEKKQLFFALLNYVLKRKK